MSERIILYTSSYCLHSRSVERILNRNGIPVQIINIDRDRQARERLIAINQGYASVPTLIFPDGSKLTEPSTRELRAKLNIELPTMTERLKSFLGR